MHTYFPYMHTYYLYIHITLLNSHHTLGICICHIHPQRKKPSLTESKQHTRSHTEKLNSLRYEGDLGAPHGPPGTHHVVQSPQIENCNREKKPSGDIAQALKFIRHALTAITAMSSKAKSVESGNAQTQM